MPGKNGRKSREIRQKSEAVRVDDIPVDDLLMWLYLQSMLDSFRQRMLEFYADSDTTEERFERVSFIREKIQDIGNPKVPGGVPKGSDVKQNFSIRPEEPKEGVYTCPPGYVCINGVCVKIS